MGISDGIGKNDLGNFARKFFSKSNTLSITREMTETMERSGFDSKKAKENLPHRDAPDLNKDNSEPDR